MWNQLVQSAATLALRMFPAGLRAWPNLAAITLAGAAALHCAMWAGVWLTMVVSQATAGLRQILGFDLLMPGDPVETAYLTGLGAGAAITAVLVFFVALDDAIEARLAADRPAPADGVHSGS